ncbi:MAG: cytochrome-c peroxidase [Alphaproteobacteria bacterium]
MRKLILLLCLSGLFFYYANADEKAEITDIFNRHECLSCHINQSHASSGKTIQVSMRDVELGMRYFDMWQMYNGLQQNGLINEPSLAKLLVAINKNSLKHQQTNNKYAKQGLNAAATQILKNWIMTESQKYNEGAEIADKFKGDFIRPITQSFVIDEAKAQLGEKLFHNTKLSFDDTVSCASCHSIWSGGDDGLDVAVGVDGAKGTINAPTVLNAAYNIAFFWDGRAVDLADQASKPPMNPVEMASYSWDQIIDKLKEDTVLTAAFNNVYPDGITADNITNAISEFEKTLITPNSRFDQYLKGDENALNEQEKQGYALFKQYQCNTCHVGEAMGGQSYEYMGRAHNYFADRNKKMIFEDDGRFNITNQPYDRHKFKVPTLRNIALTAPYFHDAHAKTLEDAVKITLTYETNAEINEAEVEQIVAFLKSLTGEYKEKQLKP